MKSLQEVDNHGTVAISQLSLGDNNSDLTLTKTSHRSGNNLETLPPVILLNHPASDTTSV